MDENSNKKDNINNASNLFSLASKEIEEEQEDSLNLFSSAAKEINLTNNEEQIEKTNETFNPFAAISIQNDSKEEIKDTKVLENDKSLMSKTTPVTDIEEKNSEDNNIHQTEIPNITTNINNDEKEQSKANEITNPFIVSEPKKVINPFIVEDNKETISKKDEEIKKEQPNPFFASSNIKKEPETQDINPFFNNPMELNENAIHKNNSKLDLNQVPHYDVKIQKKKPKKLKFILGVLSYAIFIWLLLIGAALLVYVANIKIRAMKGDYSAPKYNAYVVLTGSMLPEIQVEDVVVTKKIEPSKLKKGDIITFASSDERYYGTIITHRIIETYYDSTTGKYTFKSKGDNNNVEDNALVEQDNIYGKVILKIPKLGYLQVFLASKGGWILVVLLPCAVVISFDIMKLFKIVKKKKLKIKK